jgi:cytochrome c oxidase subunit 2
VAQGKPALDPYSFDYLLLCNKICGACDVSPCPTG